MGLFGKEKNIDELYYEGKKNIEQSKYKEAIKCFDKVIKLNPNYAQAWNGKYKAFRKLGKSDKSSICADEFIRLTAKELGVDLYDASDVAGLLNQGARLDNMGKHREAITSYDKALEIEPKNRQVWICKGTALTKLHKWDDAEKCFDKAKELE